MVIGGGVCWGGGGDGGGDAWGRGAGCGPAGLAGCCYRCSPAGARNIQTGGKRRGRSASGACAAAGAGGGPII